MQACRICGGTDVRSFLAGSPHALTADDLRITDRRYGLSAPMVQCTGCGFVFASPSPTDDLLALYASLEDPDYLDGHDYRLRQMDRLLGRVLARAPAGRTLLDIGAGSGLLVEAARGRGLDAVGVEPSRFLVRAAEALGLPVLEGTWPHPGLVGRRFNLVTMVDVIEHVHDPLALLRQGVEALAPGGTLVVTTPDPESVARRLLRGRWWHFRLAHVCFLPIRALEQALGRVGLELVHRERQVWWFSVGYLTVRVGRLLGGERLASLLEPIGASRVLSRLQIPLDLRDSWVVLATRPSGA